MYPELMVIPMREELTRAGVNEARTAAEVDSAVAQPGTTMVIVNSICGCAAGKMRPGVRLAMQNGTKPRPRRHRLRRAGPRGHRARPRLLRRPSPDLAGHRHSARRPARLPHAALRDRDLDRARHRPGTGPRLRHLLRQVGRLSTIPISDRRKQGEPRLTLFHFGTPSPNPAASALVRSSSIAGCR